MSENNIDNSENVKANSNGLDEENSKGLSTYIEQLDELQNNSTKNESSRELGQLTAIVAGMALLMQSNSANAASLSDLIKKFAEEISKTLTDQLTPMFENIMAIFSGDWGSLMKSEGDKTTVTIAKTGDSINQVAKTLEQERIKRETAPRPNACALDEAASNELANKEKAKVTSAKVNEIETKKYSEETPLEQKPGWAKVSKLINTPNVDISKILNPSIHTQEKLNPNEVKQAYDYVDILKATASEGVSIRRHNPDMSQPSLNKQKMRVKLLTSKLQRQYSQMTYSEKP